MNIKPAQSVLIAISSMYQLKEINTEEKNTLVALVKEAIKERNWDTIRLELASRRTHSHCQIVIDRAIDATRG